MNMLLILIKNGLMKMKSDNTYKYYLFYLLNDNGSPELYGYTDEKNIAKCFKKERDMNKFVCKVHELTSNEIKMLHDKYSGAVIVIYEGYGKKRGHGSGTVNASIAMISDEYHSIISEYGSLIDHDFMTYARYSPSIFNKEIKDALKYIDYNEWYKLFDARESDVGNDYDLDVIEAFICCYGKLLGGNE